MAKSRGVDPRAHSRLVVDGIKQTPSRSMLRAVGFKDEDFTKPQIGIASTWANITPCNMHIGELAQEAVAGARCGGRQSRPLQYHHRFRWHRDGLPGHALLPGLAGGDRGLDRDRGRRRGVRRFRRLGRMRQEYAWMRHGDGAAEPSVGFRLWRHDPPGVAQRDIVAVFEAVGARAAGKISDEQLAEVERTAIPGPGSCGGMYTANTMASAIEALGLSLPGSSAQEAVSGEKRADCRRAGEAVVALVRQGIRPRDILTRKAFQNAITVVIALGGSTNAVLHLLAIAHDARG